MHPDVRQGLLRKPLCEIYPWPPLLDMISSGGAMKRQVRGGNMRHSTRVGWMLLCAALMLATSDTQAQPAKQDSRAFEAYGRGQRLFGEHNYTAAQAAFEEAYQADPNPVVLLSIAEAQQRRSMWNEAIVTFERYLIERPDAPDRERVRQEVEAIRDALAPVVEKSSGRATAPNRTISPVTIVHDSKMSSTFELVRAVYSIDGTPVLTRMNDDRGLTDREEFALRGATLAPGVHLLTVDLEYRGSSYGLFSYLEGYRYNVHSSHAFSTALGNAVYITVVAYELGGPTTPRQQRLNVRYVERIMPATATSSADVSLAQSDVQ